MISEEWKARYVLESNKIDPQSGYKNALGDPHYDDHLEALNAAIAAGESKQLASPLVLHQLLTQHFKEMKNWSGVYRMHNVMVGGRVCPDWADVSRLMNHWFASVQDKVLLRNATSSARTVWDVHIDFEHIHPFIDGNGRTGRLLMVNHALILGLEPWIVEYDKVRDYYAKF
jgi:Fic family protein